MAYCSAIYGCYGSDGSDATLTCHIQSTVGGFDLPTHWATSSIIVLRSCVMLLLQMKKRQEETTDT